MISNKNINQEMEVGYEISVSILVRIDCGIIAFTVARGTRLEVHTYVQWI